MKIFTQISVFLSLLAILFLSYSCEKPGTSFPLEPKIAFKSHELLNNNGNYTLRLYLDFTDGDGDIGLSEEDSLAPFADSGSYYFNIIAKYYEKINGEFTQLTVNYPFPTGDTIHYNGRLPVLTPKGKQKAIKGEIQYDIAMGGGPKNSNTIKFKIYIYDRALHKSNEIETPEILFE
ncbi:MAG: hypothetical protein EOP53_16820 [Sphingobacteriales bacterium]|nr:MAG: hypothetical protein EOP53_16820 [Sphingobacteriales bacterium]